MAIFFGFFYIENLSAEKLLDCLGEAYSSVEDLTSL